MARLARSCTILIADDEPSILRSTQLLLQDLGFKVLITSNFEDIPRLIASEKPDILLQDVRMPGLDLGRLVRSIRHDPKTGSIPVLLYSASLDLPEIQAAVGAQGYIEKPFQPDEIVTAIESALGA
ncbi:MAG: response regulator [Thermoplasmatota archaeon]